MADLNASPFLRLPAEIRQEIYRHVLPYSIHKVEMASLTWHSNGGTSILRANRFVYNEAIRILYSENTFAIRIGPGDGFYTPLIETGWAGAHLSLGQCSISLRRHPIADLFKAIRHFYLYISIHSECDFLYGRRCYPSDSLFMIDILKEGLPIAIRFLNQVKQISTLTGNAWILKIYDEPFGLSILLEAFGALSGVGKATLHALPRDRIPEAVVKELERRLEAPRSTTVGRARQPEAEPAKVRGRVGNVPKRRRQKIALAVGGYQHEQATKGVGRFSQLRSLPGTGPLIDGTTDS